MNLSLRIVIVFVVLLTFNSFLSAETKVFTHPSPDISVDFEAPADWIEIPRVDDKNAYEVSDPDGIVHVLLWFTDTEENSDRYLFKMCDMNGMKFEGELSRKTINERKYLYGYTIGEKNDIEIKELIAVTSTNHSNLPEHQRLYIIRIWCPLDKFELHAKTMEDILNSVKISNPKVR